MRGLREFAERQTEAMQESQREQFATLTLNTAVELTGAALGRPRRDGHRGRAGARAARRDESALPRGGGARLRRPSGLHARALGSAHAADSRSRQRDRGDRGDGPSHQCPEPDRLARRRRGPLPQHDARCDEGSAHDRARELRDRVDEEREGHGADEGTRGDPDAGQRSGRRGCVVAHPSMLEARVKFTHSWMGLPARISASRCPRSRPHLQPDTGASCVLGAASGCSPSASASTELQERPLRFTESGSAREQLRYVPVPTDMTVRNPHLDWGDCVNVRDLGGHPLETGGVTRRGSVVRADALDRLTSSTGDKTEDDSGELLKVVGDL